MNDQPEHSLNVEMNYISDMTKSTVDDATDMKREIHDVISRYPDLTVYAIIGALRVVEYDLMDALMESNMENRDQTIT